MSHRRLVWRSCSWNHLCTRNRFELFHGRVIKVLGRRAILTIRNGHRAVVVAPGHATEIGSRIVSFGDPVICDSGRILVDIIDDHDRNLLDAVDSSNAVRLAMPVVHSSKLIGGFAPPVLAGRLAVNEGGAFTFIGGK